VRTAFEKLARLVDQQKGHESLKQVVDKICAYDISKMDGFESKEQRVAAMKLVGKRLQEIAEAADKDVPALAPLFDKQFQGKIEEMMNATVFDSPFDMQKELLKMLRA